MRTAYLTDPAHSTLKPRDVLILAVVAILSLMVFAGLVSGSNREGLSALTAPATVSHAAELTADEPQVEDVALYILDKDAEFVGL